MITQFVQQPEFTIGQNVSQTQKNQNSANDSTENKRLGFMHQSKSKDNFKNKIENFTVSLRKDKRQQILNNSRKLASLNTQAIIQNKVQPVFKIEHSLTKIKLTEFMQELDVEFKERFSSIDSMEKYSLIVKKCKQISVQPSDMELIMIFQSDVNDFVRLLSTILFCDAIIQQVFEIYQYFRDEQFMKTLMATIFCERNLYIKYHKVLMICSLITLRLFEESTVKLLVEQCNLIDLMSEVLNMLQNCDTSQQNDEKLLAITFEEILWLIVPICNESNQYKEILVSQNCISKIFNILKKFKEWSSSTEFILYEVFNQLLYGRFLGTEEEISQALNFCVQNTVSFLNKLDENLCFKTDKSEVFQGTLFEQVSDLIQTLQSIFNHFANQKPINEQNYNQREEFEKNLISKLYLLSQNFYKSKGRITDHIMVHGLALDIINLIFRMLESCQEQDQQIMIHRFVQYGLIEAINSYLDVAQNQEDHDLRNECYSAVLQLISQIACLNQSDDQLIQLLIGNQVNSIAKKVLFICSNIENYGFNESQIYELLSILYNFSCAEQPAVLLQLIKMQYIESCYHMLLQFKLKQNYLNEILETFENLANVAYKDAFDLELFDAVQCKFIEGAQDRTGLDIFIEIMDQHKENKTIQEICDNIMETMLCPSEFDDLIFKPEDNNNSNSNHKQQFSI